MRQKNELRAIQVCGLFVTDLTPSHQIFSLTGQSQEEQEEQVAEGEEEGGEEGAGRGGEATEGGEGGSGGCGATEEGGGVQQRLEEAGGDTES